MLRVIVLVFPLMLLFSTLAVFAEELPPQTPAKPHKQVTVPNRTLDRYVGSYALPGVILKVTREANHLFVQENDKPRKEIFAESEFSFYSKGSDDVIVFQGMSHDKAIIMMIHADGKDTPAARVQ